MSHPVFFMPERQDAPAFHLKTRDGFMVSDKSSYFHTKLGQ